MASVTRIVVYCAMEAEAAPFVAHHGLVAAPGLLPPPLPCGVYAGTVHGCSVTVVTGGRDAAHGVDSVGTVAAALSVSAALSALSPVHLLLNVGTAGGFAALGGAVGDVYLATGTRHHGRRIPIPGFSAFGVYALPSHPAAPSLAAALGFKTGVVSSGDSLDASVDDLAELGASGAAVKDMEAASVAYVARMHGVPLLALKAVTDVVDGGRPTAEEFLANLGAAAAALQAALPRLIGAVAGKRLDEL